jgi:hypothetical protein
MLLGFELFRRHPFNLNDTGKKMREQDFARGCGIQADIRTQTISFSFSAAWIRSFQALCDRETQSGI